MDDLKSVNQFQWAKSNNIPFFLKQQQQHITEILTCHMKMQFVDVSFPTGHGSLGHSSKKNLYFFNQL